MKSAKLRRNRAFNGRGEMWERSHDTQRASCQQHGRANCGYPSMRDLNSNHSTRTIENNKRKSRTISKLTKYNFYTSNYNYHPCVGLGSLNCNQQTLRHSKCTANKCMLAGHRCHANTEFGTHTSMAARHNHYTALKHVARCPKNVTVSSTGK